MVQDAGLSYRLPFATWENVAGPMHSYVVRFGDCSGPQDVRDFLATWAHVEAQDWPYHLTMDMTQLGCIPAGSMLQVASFINHLHGGTLLTSSAIVAPRSWMRTLIRALFVIAPPVAPVVVVKCASDLVQVA